MLPPAPMDDAPRSKAVAAPRGGGPSLSTALDQPRTLGGQEEAAYERPHPKAPTDTIPAAPTAELPPSPIGPLPAPPPAFRIGGGPTKTNIEVFDLQTSAPTALPPAPLPALSPPMAVEAKPASLVAPRLSVSPPMAVTSSQLQPPPALEQQPPSDDLAANLRSLYERASRRYATMDSYTLRMRRREVVAGKARPEELILSRFRREPFSLYLKWIGEESKNREVCFVKGQHDDLVHTLMAPGDLFLFAGKHFKVAPDSPLVKSNCRYPITEAGFGPVIARFGRLTTAIEKGDAREGAAKLLGKVKRPEFEEPLDGVLQTLPVNFESLFPGGGQRHWYFDAANGLPVLIVTFDHQGKEVEYYCHDRIQAPANLDDDDFNPYRLWKEASRPAPK
jgi:hypothetical protein